MRYSSHCRAINAPPCYQTERIDVSRETHALATPAFPREFHGSRNCRKRLGRAVSGRPSARIESSSSASPWSSAFAVILVANLIAPSALAMPTLPRFQGGQREWDDAAGNASASASVGLADASPDVEMYPLPAPGIKLHYTLREFLRAVASASAPFRSLGKTLGDVYSAISGEDVDPPALETAKRIGGVVDAATGLIPRVQLARLPAHLAGLTADALDGKFPQVAELTSLVQLSDPRTFGNGVPEPQEAPEAPEVPPLWFRRASMHEPAPVDDALAVAPSDGVADDLDPDSQPAPVIADQRDDRSHLPDTDDAASAKAMRIEGEHHYLQGYEQPLPSHAMPSMPDRQLIAVNGRRYLVGESGYYHVTPGQSADHWLINAPRGTRAQVPVRYDAQTGKWQADAPLRLCGGGCGPSRESTPDSVAMSKNDVAEAIRHIADRDVRDAIQQAYSDLAHLHLMRTNREDLRSLRDNSIVEHRRVLVHQLMRLDPHSTLFEQQREAALITAMHYDNYIEYSLADLGSEAFCQENAEILFHYLLTRGVPGNNIRMITVRSQGRPPHVMVLYTESDPFIDLLDLTTPQPPVFGHDDGIPGDMFAGALFLSRGSTVLLDPWSRIKASSFPWTNDADDVRRMLEIALADTGRIPGSPYTVSLTRPYPAPRERAASSSGSSLSMRSQGSSAGDSIRSGPSHRTPPGASPKRDHDTPL